MAYPDIVVYQTDDERIPTNRRFMAYMLEWSRPVPERGLGSIPIVLPVYFTGESAAAAVERAKAFWDDESRKKRERRERASRLTMRKAG